VVKHLNKTLEDHRTAVRNIRRDGNDLIKKSAKDKKISEDEEKRSLEEMQNSPTMRSGAWKRCAATRKEKCCKI